MGKYRKKPIVIEAFCWTGDNEQVEDPVWFLEALRNGTAWFNNVGTDQVELEIATPSGNHIVRRGDYILKGIQGEIYLCKSDIFHATYDLVNLTRR